MSRRPWFALGLVSMAIPLGCSPSLPLPTAAHAESARLRFPKATVESLTEARSTYARKCSGCHALQLPDRASAAEWPEAIQRMRVEHGVVLTKRERAQILAYVQFVRSPAPAGKLD